ncbi:hypothetical protein PP304_gp153 [Gordonia phage Phendrix]|uniref:Uncharacterized protein n=1 Tax=Gordonia phage Phendrix TaxID=2593335 RepID=A0A514U1B9_9CAUD|nr:hypothetical protein PP304_gp153 [Gordonia phage Phendrix]QDK02716.1 hypothetical protein SEA_PHENDRIX_200 [Gordonia phage Phendrix]
MIHTWRKFLESRGVLFDWTRAKPYEMYADRQGDYWLTRECTTNRGTGVQYRVLKIGPNWYVDDSDRAWTTVSRMTRQNFSAYAPFTPLSDKDLASELQYGGAPAVVKTALRVVQRKRLS